MDLHDQPRLQLFLLQPPEHLDHGQLHNIRRRTLDGHVQRHPLPEGPGRKLGRLDLRQRPAAVEQRLHIAVLPGLRHHVLHIPLHAGEARKIGVHIVLGVRRSDPQVLGQGEGGDAVHNAEIHRLGCPAHLSGDLRNRHAEDLGGGDGVEILPGEECVPHGLVLGDVGQQPQLDLAVIRVHQHFPRPGHEHAPQLAAQLRAGGDVLQVRLRGAEPPGGGDGHLEAGADPPVRANDLHQTVHVGALQLGVLPVLQHVLHNGVLTAQLVQYLRVGGPAGFCALAVGHAQALKEDLPQLLGGIDVELPGIGVDFLLQRPDGVGQRFAELRQGPGVHPEARRLHLRQHPAQGQLDAAIQLLHAGLLQFGQHDVMQCADGVGVAAHGGLGLGGISQGGEGGPVQKNRLGQLLPEIGGEKPLDLIVPRRGVQQIAGQGGVKDKALRREAVFQEDAGQVLDVVGHLFDVPGEQGGQQPVPVAGVAIGKQLRHAAGIRPGLAGDGNGGQIVQRQQGHVVRPPPDVQQPLRLLRLRHPIHMDGAVRRRLFRRRGFLGGEAHLFNELVEFQP